MCMAKPELVCTSMVVNVSFLLLKLLLETPEVLI